MPRLTTILQGVRMGGSFLYGTFFRRVNDKKFIEFLYQVVLNRPADKSGLRHWIIALRTGLTPEALFDKLLRSEEFKHNCLGSPLFKSLISRMTGPAAAKGGRDAGVPDRIDALRLIQLKDDWQKFEQVLAEEHRRAKNDPALDYHLKSLYLNEDRPEAFDRFYGSYEFTYTKHALKVLGLKETEKIIEVGGGGGYLAWALSKSGFSSIDLFEPNASFTSGTGYLRSRADAGGIRIFNDLEEWNRDPLKYDAILTKACLHHFANISHVAAGVRQKMRTGGRWYVLREPFADSASEFAGLLADHSYSQRHDLYEWSYPAASYIEAFEMVGLRLKAIVPAYYANDVIASYNEKPLTAEALRFTEEIDRILLSDPEETVRRLWVEHHGRKLGSPVLPQYTRPQIMVFEKCPVG